MPVTAGLSVTADGTSAKEPLAGTRSTSQEITRNDRRKEDQMYAYEDALTRAESLRSLIPEPWHVIPVGSREAGYRLGIKKGVTPGIQAWLSSDEDVECLILNYIEQLA
jgi:hypothetical protein